MGTIYIKELRGYFKSFFGWLFLAVYTAFCSLYFVIYNLLNGNPYLSQTVSNLVVILMFVFPLLTMRVLAEEKKLKTDQLLLTSPIRVSSVILGKFFALVTMMLISSVVLLLGLLIMSIYGDVPVPESLLSILAIILLGSMFAAIGVFLSSITEHQFVAALLTYGAFIFIMLVPAGIQVLFSSNKVISTIGKAIDFLSPFDKLLTGIISAKDIFYIVSVIAVFLILAVRVFAKSSLQVSVVGAKKFWFSTLGLVALIAIIIGANIGISFIPDQYLQADLTKNKYYTVTQESKNLLATLDKDVTIHVLSDRDGADKTLVMYLDSYQNASKHIKVKYHSDKSEPTFYKTYTDEVPSLGSVIVVCGDKNWIVDADSFYEKEYSIDYSTYQYVANETGIDIEGQISAAIAYVTSDAQYKVYILEGHGELALPASVGKQMEKAGFTYASLNLLSMDTVPDDCQVLIVNGPSSDLSTEDVAKIEDYLGAGGAAVFMAADDILDTPNYDKLLSGFGAEIVDGTIWENNVMYTYQNNGFYLVELPVAHEITNEQYSSNRPSLLVQSRGFIIGDAEDPNISIEALFQSSDDSLAVVMDENGEVTTDESEMQNGPFVLGYYASRATEAGRGRVTVIGSPVFLHETIDAATSNANSGIFINSLCYMCDMKLNTTVPVKKYEASNIFVSAGLVYLYAGLLVVLLPLAELVAGIVIMIVRRRK